MLTKIITSIINDINTKLGIPTQKIPLVYSQDLDASKYSRYRQQKDLAISNSSQEIMRDSQIILEYATSHLKPYRDTNNVPQVGVVNLSVILDDIFNRLREDALINTQDVSKTKNVDNEQWQQYSETTITPNYDLLTQDEKETLLKWLNGEIPQVSKVPIHSSIPFSTDLTLRWITPDTDAIMVIQMGLLASRGSHSVVVPFSIGEYSIEIPYEYSINPISESGFINLDVLGSIQYVEIELNISGILISPKITQFADIIENIIVEMGVK